MKLTSQDTQLIEKAKEIIVKSSPVNLVNTGDVGCALITSKGNVFQGVCIGFYCNLASCAEYQAIGSMISNGENEIKTIVAVWYDAKSKRYLVIPPCGSCREMIKQAATKNKDTWVVISATEKVKLAKLLPNAWPGTIEK